jgi:putative cell wall-binding protein
LVLRRSALITLLAVGLLVGGLIPPVAAERPIPIPPTVTDVLDGMPGDGSAARMPGLRAFAVDGPALSRPVRTMPFTMIGFEFPLDAEVEFRTSLDGQDWSVWQLAEEMDEEPDPDADEHPGDAAALFSDPFWVGEAEHVQVRVAGAAPEDVSVHLIDSMGLGRSLVARTGDVLAAIFRNPAPAVAAVGGPTILSRAQWGADESFRKGTPSYATNARVAVVHHTASSNDYTRDGAAGAMRGIYSYHTRTLGWNDVGYNILVDRFGTIYEGRYGGLERAVVGAHAGGWNTGTFGVALIGQHHSGASPSYAPATVAAISSLINVLAWKLDVHHIDATATATLTSGGAGTSRYAQGVQVTVPTIIGHNTLSSTACPGSNILNQMDWIRQQVRERQQPMFVQPSVSPTALSVSERSPAQPDPVQFEAALKPAGAWTLQVADRTGGIVETVTGSGDRVSHSWRPPARPDVYTYSITAPSRRPVTGEISVVSDNVDRIGAARSGAAASVELSREAFPDAGEAEHAVIARADVFADAMAGGPLAGEDGPLLLTGSDSLDSDVLAELERVLPAGATVYVLGGESALSKAVTDRLANRWEVERLSGAERTATAAAVAEVVWDRAGTSTAMVARAGPDTGAPWADALAGGAYGATAGVPVLLTYTDTLTPATRDALAGATGTIVLGGTAAIAESVARQLPNARRVSGGTRAATAVAIAEQLWDQRTGLPGDDVLVGDGFSTSAWTLALAASPLAARTGAPLLLTAPDALPPETREHLLRLDYGGKGASAYVLGGSSAVGDVVVAELSRLLR